MKNILFTLNFFLHNIFIGFMCFASNIVGVLQSDNDFTEQMPDEIQCVDIGFTYRGHGMPPVLNSGLSNNIIPNWNYCLAGYVQQASARLPEDTFAMFFLESSTFNPISDFKLDRRDPYKIANPLPQDLDSLDIFINVNKFSHIQKTLGLFFCPYYLKTGDIFPLADSLYYVEKPLFVKKLNEDFWSHYRISRTPNTLCIPLDSSNSESSSFGGLTYLHGLNFRVVRIYSVVNEEGYKEHIARICTVDTEKIISVAKGNRFNEIPGSPNIKKLPDKNLDPLMEKMNVQELYVGNIIQGEKIGYQITAIVPPDYVPWRKIEETLIKGRLIGWVELDPTPIPIDENGKPVEQQAQSE